MSDNIFEQFRNGVEVGPEEGSNTSEERTYIITKPETKDEITVQFQLRDCLQEDGYTKRITSYLLETGCCGQLTSFDHERYRPPSGRCQNPNCRVLLCHVHVEEKFSCVVCRRPLCFSCLRRTISNNLNFCTEHFKEYVTKHQEDIIKEIKCNSQPIYDNSCSSMRRKREVPH